MQSRGGAAVRQLGSFNTRPVRLRNPGPVGSRAYVRPHPAQPTGRVLGAGPRIIQSLKHLSSRQYSSAFQKRVFQNTFPTHPLSGLLKIHESRFPTKSIIFLAALGTIAYFFVEVVYVDWTDDLIQTFGGDVSATPLQFYDDRDDVDHWIARHIPDLISVSRTTGFFHHANENFDQGAGGWMMNEDDARENNTCITHGCRWESNYPCEDWFALGTGPGPGSRLWSFWSVYDGHAGLATAKQLHYSMIPHLSRALSNLPATSSSQVIETTIKDTFVRLDEDIMLRARHAAKWFPAASAPAIAALTPAFAGSCALVAAFNPENSTLRVACTGDSRAVLGRWDPLEEKYTSIPLSVDQTGFNPKEVERITAEHPDEPDIIDPSTGRLLGLAVTRAFGDHRWKWDNELIRDVQHKFWGTAPRPNSKTPPYMTAEPDITETKIVRVDPNNKDKENTRSDFMILATDGLWDRISSDHAVECIQRWLESRDRGNGSVLNDPQTQSYLEKYRSLPTSPANNTNLEPGVTADSEAGRTVSWRAEPQYFAIEDENAAVCLTRNVMGGTRKGLHLGLGSLPPITSRNAIDDTTVMVVFFDQLDGESKSGKEGGRKEGGKKAWAVGLPGIGLVSGLGSGEKRWWWPW